MGVTWLPKKLTINKLTSSRYYNFLTPDSSPYLPWKLGTSLLWCLVSCSLLFLKKPFPSECAKLPSRGMFGKVANVTEARLASDWWRLPPRRCSPVEVTSTSLAIRVQYKTCLGWKGTTRTLDLESSSRRRRYATSLSPGGARAECVSLSHTGVGRLALVVSWGWRRRREGRNFIKRRVEQPPPLLASKLPFILPQGWCAQGFCVGEPRGLIVC